jgi:phosphatidate cytidylyltransferase
MYGLWETSLYRQTAALVIGSLFLLAILFFIFRRRGPVGNTGWASIKSWIFVAPMLFAVFAIPKPWPLIFITFVAVISAKTFFQMVGMYHRSWFVWMTYIFIFGLGYMTYENLDQYYNISPMLFLGCIALIPLIRNSAAQMIQYLALSLIAFCFWGWSLMHMGRLVMVDGGPLLVLYLYLLTEVSENVCWTASKLFGRIKPFNKISQKVTLEGMIAALIVTMLLAWGLRHLLPDRSEKFWIVSGLVAAVFGRFGDLILSVIRRDLGIKNTGIFIIGRGDILSRVDKLIFVAPAYYYLFVYLQQLQNV